MENDMEREYVVVSVSGFPKSGLSYLVGPPCNKDDRVFRLYWGDPIYDRNH